jgi:hypothetical protein
MRSVRAAASLMPLVWIGAACGSPSASPQPTTTIVAPAPSSSASAEPADDPLPKLRTGALAPVDQPGDADLPVVARHVANGYECIGARLPSTLSFHEPRVAIDAPAGSPVPLAFVASATHTSPDAERTDERWLWVRRPTATADVHGDLYVDAEDASPGRHYRFHVTSPGAKASDPKALRWWLDGLGESMGGYRWLGTGIRTWAYSRIGRMAEALAPTPQPVTRGRKPKPAQPIAVRPRPVPPRRPGELGGFIETTTGWTAVQETLQTNRALWDASPQHKNTVPLASLQSPKLQHHPWADMLAKLDPPPDEPLAADVPAEFYYVRASGLGALLDLLVQGDAWGTSLSEILDDASEDRALAPRYEAQLGVRRTALTRMLGPEVVGQVAVVGSDPYVRDGTDLTLVMRVKQRSLLDAALAAAQGELEKEHGSIAHETRDHGGVTVSISRSADGAVHQQRASSGDLELVSNSPGAIDAILDTIAAKHPRLSDEVDFRFMLARDAKERADVLAFFGDRFVAEVVGPRQKILAMRRDDAEGELRQLGYAALVYGQIQGRSPRKVDELLGAGLLSPDELRHADGEAISWQVGSAPRSVWGSPAAMTPLIDRPAPDKVSPDEKVAYEGFARSYQDNFSHYIDPAALRASFTGDGDHRTLSMSFRELPLIDRTEYHDLSDFVGAARFTARPATGVRVTVGISHDSDLRNDFTRTVREFSGDKLKFDWIGDWATIGMADRTSIATILTRLAGNKLPQMYEKKDDDSDDDDLGQLANLPIYAEIGVKGTAQAAVALAAMRVVADQTIPGMFTWGETGRERDVPLVRVALKGDAVRGLTGERGGMSIYYAVVADALVVTTTEWALRRLVDERLDGAGPDQATAHAPDSEQVSFDLASGPSKGLWTAIAWLTEMELLDDAGQRSKGEADALLRGAPEIAGDPAAVRALALAYYGAVPVTPDGAPYTLGPEGVRDPARGSRYAPAWPDVPVPGSPVDQVLRALRGLHSRVAFDDEGKDGDRPMRSLHASATLELGPH